MKQNVTSSFAVSIDNKVLVVGSFSWIFCSLSDGTGTRLSRPILDRIIDLKWFGNDQNEFVWSN